MGQIRLWPRVHVVRPTSEPVVATAVVAPYAPSEGSWGVQYRALFWIPSSLTDGSPGSEVQRLPPYF